MLNKDFATSTANIAKSFIKPAAIAPQEDLVGVLTGAYKGYQDNQNRDALIAALQGGNETEIDNAYAKVDPLSYVKNYYETKRMQQQNDGKMTNDARNYEYLVGQGLAPERARAIAFGGNTEAVGNALVSGNFNGVNGVQDLGKAGMQAYDKEMGKALAEEEIKQNANSAKYESNIADLDNLMKHIKKHPDSVNWTAPLITPIARVIGDDDYLTARGYTLRQLGAIQNNLIAEARAAGQSGINTVGEIQQATKGLNENSSDEEVLAALGAMKESIQRLRAKGVATDYKSKYGLE